jgi:predicted enzyme related to lactoylglutathione lyase
MAASSTEGAYEALSGGKDRAYRRRMEIDRYAPGVPSWVDLGTPDPTGAFYASLLGWEVTDAGPDAGGYAIASLRGRRVAGFGPQQSPGPPYWTTYVNVDDTDATVELVRDNGGMVFVEPMDVMTEGRMAICADPSGAAFGVWQPRDHTGAQLVNEPGTWGWSELLTRDLAGAATFYAAVFGWTADDRGNGAYTEWQVDGRSVGGMMAMPPMIPAEVPPNWGVYFIVEDCDAAAARAVDLGATQVNPPQDIEPGRFAVLSDPHGAFFSVMALKDELPG